MSKQQTPYKINIVSVGSSYYALLSGNGVVGGIHLNENDLQQLSIDAHREAERLTRIKNTIARKTDIKRKTKL